MDIPGIGFHRADESINGFALNGRVGYTFSTGSENTFNASFEVSPGFYSEDGGDGTVTAITLLIGYQHL